VASKEVVIHTAPAKVETALAKIEAAPKVEPVSHEALKAEPFVAPVVREAEPVMAADSIPEPVKDTIAAAADLAAASAQAVSQSITTTADNFAAVTAEVVEAAPAIEPTNPNLTPNLTQGMKTMMKSTEDFVAFGQANLEAFVKSGQIWSAGMQELTKQIASSAKASFDESVSTFKAMSTAKSVKEAMELQSSYAKAALEKAMSESNKLTDA